MRLLLDINVLLDVAFARAGEAASSELIARCGREHEGWLAWHSIATLAYLIERQASARQAREFIGGLLAWTDVAPSQRADAIEALALPMPDFEDALQCVAAAACGAQAIVTRNVRDFKGSTVPAMTPESFLSRFHGRRRR